MSRARTEEILFYLGTARWHDCVIAVKGRQLEERGSDFCISDVVDHNDFPERPGLFIMTVRASQVPHMDFVRARAGTYSFRRATQSDVLKMCSHLMVPDP